MSSLIDDDNQSSSNPIAGIGPDKNNKFAINEPNSDEYATRNTNDDDRDFSPDDKNYDDEDSEEDESVLPQIENEYIHFEKRFLYQKRALFRKNLALQWRQKGTNICQILSPILGLLIIVVFKELGIQGIVQFQDRPVFIPFPQLFGMNLKAISSIAPGIIDISTCNQWYMYHFDNKTSKEDIEFFGYNEGLPWKSPDSEGMINSKTNVLSYPCEDVNRTVPYFEQYTQDKYSMGLQEYLANTLHKFSEQEISMNDKNPYLKDSDSLPDGVYLIKESNKKRLRYNLQINDNKRWQYHRNNGITKIGITDRETNSTMYNLRTIDGALVISDIMNQAYLRTLFNDTTVVGGVQFMPFLTDVLNNVQKIVSLAGIMVLPLCMSMGLPVFLYQIVLEKENRLIENMKINGMRMSNYWIVNFFFNLAFYCLTALLFMLFGTKVFALQFFVDTNPFILILTLFGWGLSQISTAFFLSVFLNKSQSATIVGYLFAVWMTTISTTLNLTIYGQPHEMDWFFYPLPAFAFGRTMYYLARDCGYTHCTRGFEDLNNETQAGLVMMYVDAAVYMVLAMYLYQVVPQTYGQHKKWNYICKKSKKKLKPLGNFGEDDQAYEIEEDEIKDEPQFVFDQSLEDADSKAERNMVYNLDKSDYFKYPLIIKDLHKIYPSMGGIPPKVATKSFCLRIKKGEIFGMLGPNGAGKTTLISMLTGMYRPTSGNAWVAGNDIRSHLDVVQLQIGLCPQFDLLWGDLTVEEHLLFFARLKGIEPDVEYEKVRAAMADVLLSKFKDFPVKALSGGMKRRLSVAISLVSDPKIIFLDEPSTGLDPENRRQLWDILSAQKGKKAMILTTHSMEEADVLCNRIGIVSDGVLRCVAPQVRLKSIYGGGYHLFINCQRGKVLSLQKAIKQAEEKKIRDGNLELSPSKPNEDWNNDIKGGLLSEEDDLDFSTVIKRIRDFIKREVPLSKLIREFNGNFTYQIPLQDFKAESFYYSMERNRQRLRITDWGISQCSLEDVFSQICETK